MNWNSLHDFLSMGGYGSYVWGSFGAAAVLGLTEVIALRRRMRQARALVRAVHRGRRQA